MEIDTYSFQIDSEIVQEYYKTQDNYLIEFSPKVQKEYCIIYFTSNDLYYPNNEAAFRKRFVNANYYEWYRTRINKGHKHIFIRDIHKQWHLSGINSRIDTPEKLLNFLKNETSGYKIITIGSSAGGFAAVLYGQLLDADKILTFNGNFEIESKLISSSAEICPLIFRNKDNIELKKWMDSRNFINKPATIFYFHSIKSHQDIEKFKQVQHIPIHRIQFNTSHHGIPFLKVCLPHVINYSSDELSKLEGKVHHPVLFSIKTVGIVSTTKGLIDVLAKVIKSKYKKAMSKLRK